MNDSSDLPKTASTGFSVARLQAGEKVSQNEFVRNNLSRLLQYIRFVHPDHSIDREEAESIAMTVIGATIHALRQGVLSEIASNGKLMQAVKSMAKVKTRQFLESKGGLEINHENFSHTITRNEWEAMNPLEQYQWVISDESDPNNLALIINDKDMVLAGLPTVLKSVYFLCKMGLTNEEVATCLDYSIHEISIKVYEIRRRIRDKKAIPHQNGDDHHNPASAGQRFKDWFGKVSDSKPENQLEYQWVRY